MADTLRYDYSFMLDEVVGNTGATQTEVDALKEKLLKMRHEYFLSERNKLGFMGLPYDQATLELIQNKVSDYQNRFDNLLVLGIGGSDLGARAALSALKPLFSAERSSGMRVYFLGGNTDPCEIEETLAVLDLAHTAINVISKSGDTVETMSTFLYVREKLIEAVGYETHKSHIIATTDASRGTLRTIVDAEGYDSLIVPDNVGGRFSVLSTVGLFPIAFGGVAIAELLEGARDLCESLYTCADDKLHMSEIFAALHYLGLTKRGQHVHVFVPYSIHLREVGFWFRQLWAESLGKKDNLAGEEVHVGPTPIAALGATDQHSQYQLYYHGPFDKLITFVEVADFGCDIAIPSAFDTVEGVSYMKDIRFGEIIAKELKGSALALAQRKRPNGRLILSRISPHSIGQLFQFLEIATAYMGGLLDINTYDQPAVELGKHNVYALLSRPGFEKQAAELDQYMRFYEKHVV